MSNDENDTGGEMPDAKGGDETLVETLGKLKEIMSSLEVDMGKSVQATDISSSICSDLDKTVRLMEELIARLEEEGEVTKDEDGRYHFQHPASRTEAENIYRELYEAMNKAVGPWVTKSILGRGIDDFDAAHPVETINDMITKISKTLGDKASMKMAISAKKKTVAETPEDDESNETLRKLYEIKEYIEENKGKSIQATQMSGSISTDLEETIDLMDALVAKLSTDGKVTIRLNGGYVFQHANDRNQAEQLYKALYEAMSTAVGPWATKTILGGSMDDFDAAHPSESIKAAIRKISDTMGVNSTKKITMTAIKAMRENE